jgi:transposase InsO family protein
VLEEYQCFDGTLNSYLEKCWSIIHSFDEFSIRHIIHRFGIPQTLTTDQGTSFMSKEVREFAELYRIKLLNSSPYYAQANGQVESSNRTLINLIKKEDI